jgi:uncharacterized membrane protein HdeD (DUF308 family)
MIGNTLTIYNLNMDEEVRSPRTWRGLTAIGAIFTVLGLLALGLPVVAGLTVLLVIGWLLIFAGALQVGHVFTGRRASGSWRGILLASLAIVLGIYLVLRPIGGTVFLSALIAAYFLIDGLFSIAAALNTRGTAASGLLSISAVLSILLAVIILAMLPEAAPEILGLLVGIALLIDGIISLIIAQRMRTSAVSG